MTRPTVSYKNHRSPPSIIAHAVWFYFRFPLSLPLVEELLVSAPGALEGCDRRAYLI